MLSDRRDELTIAGHVSLGTGPEQTLAQMRAEGFAGAQIFASSPRTWHVPHRKPEDFEPIRDACLRHSMQLYIHAIYLINLASSDKTIYDRSIASLVWTVAAAAKLRARAVVLHVGSHLGRGLESVRRPTSLALSRVLADVPSGFLLLLENSAGGGGNIGVTFDELKIVMQDLGYPLNLGLCLDTAHAFAAGYDLRTAEGAERLMEAIDRSVGIERLFLIHLNDSKTELGTGRDRHENLGAGHIGEAGFAHILSRRQLSRLPLVLETPNLETRVQELRTLRRLYRTHDRVSRLETTS